jgi:hypothetical protein
MIDRVWELLSYAVQETAVASLIPAADAFEQLKAWVVDGKVQARGHWPEGPGVASSTDPVCILPHDEFRFVDRIWNRLLFLRPMKIVDDVEINIVQLRRALAENAGQPAAPVAETVPPDQSKPPKDCKKRGPQPLKRSQVKEAM